MIGLTGPQDVEDLCYTECPAPSASVIAGQKNPLLPFR